MSEAKEYDYIQQWKNILDVDTLKGNVNLISMFITVYELLEDTIISRPKDFYTIIEFDEIAKRKYEEHVLSHEYGHTVQSVMLFLILTPETKN